MDPSRVFRRTLTRRILEVSGALSLIGPVAQSGCSSEVVVGEDGDAGPTASSVGPSTGSGGTTSSAVVATTGVGGAPSTTVGAGGAGFCCGCGEMPTVCFTIDDAPCPNPAEAMSYMNLTCVAQCVELASIVSGPFEQNGQCCYEMTVGCIGRPFVVNRVATRAEAIVGDDAGWSDQDLAPTLEGLSAEIRAALARAWLDDALLEHASVASFARFAMELLAVGAPAELVAAAHRAALDEVRHAQLCFALAGAYAGAKMQPAAFPFGGSIELATDLASMAASTVVEGCVGETLAAVQAAEQLARATDPAVRAVLVIVAADEARHAELAWRAVGWALQRGGEHERRAIRNAFAGAIASASAADEAATSGLEPHGRLDAASRRALVARTLADIVVPCARALLGPAERCTADHARV